MTRLASWADYGTHDESAYPELWRGCVGAWAPCLGPTGTRLHDLSRFRNWGTLTNMDAATDWVVSAGRYALDFDGNDDNSSFEMQNTATLTACCWVLSRNISNPNGEYFVVKWGGSLGSFDFYIGAFQSNWIARTGDGMSSASSLLQSPAIANTWSHLAITRNSATLRLFVNGREVASTSAVGLQGGGTQPLRLAFLPTNFYANCQLDDIRIYNRPISEPELRLLATRRGIAYERRKRRSVFFDAAFFNPAWARNSNVILSPVGAA